MHRRTTSTNDSSNNEYTFIGKFRVRSRSREQLDGLYKKHVNQVKNKYDKLIAKKKNKNSLEHDRYIELKRCEICFDFENDKAMMLCDYCDDSYHFYCLNPPLKSIPANLKEFICEKCKKGKLSKEKTIQTTINFPKNITPGKKVIFIMRLFILINYLSYKRNSFGY